MDRLPAPGTIHRDRPCGIARSRAFHELQKIAQSCRPRSLAHVRKQFPAEITERSIGEFIHPQFPAAQRSFVGDSFRLQFRHPLLEGGQSHKAESQGDRRQYREEHDSNTGPRLSHGGEKQDQHRLQEIIIPPTPAPRHEQDEGSEVGRRLQRQGLVPVVELLLPAGLASITSASEYASQPGVSHSSRAEPLAIKPAPATMTASERHGFARFRRKIPPAGFP